MPADAAAARQRDLDRSVIGGRREREFGLAGIGTDGVVRRLAAGLGESSQQRGHDLAADGRGAGDDDARTLACGARRRCGDGRCGSFGAGAGDAVVGGGRETQGPGRGLDHVRHAVEADELALDIEAARLGGECDRLGPCRQRCRKRRDRKRHR